MSTGNEAAGIGPAPLSLLQNPQQEALGQHQRAGVRAGALPAGSVTAAPRIEAAQDAGVSGRVFPRGSFVDITA